MTKKWIMRALMMAVVFVAALVIAVPTMAMWSWCDIDPVVNINGHIVSIDVGLQGDPQQIRGEIEFTVTVPKGTLVKVVSCDSNAEVNVKYNNSARSWDKNGSNEGSTPVDISVDINTKTTFNTRVTVSMDGKQVIQETGTTKHDLDCNFIIQ